jgi:hypothetical protein
MSYGGGVDPDRVLEVAFPVPDGTDRVESDTGHAEQRPVDRFRQTAVGTVVAAGLLGLRDALEGRPEREEVAIVTEAPDRPVDDGVTLVFDEDDPAALRVVLRAPRP